MSHFTVLVIGEDVEKQMAPYQENNMGDCPKKFLEWVSVLDEYKNIHDAVKEGYRLKDGIPGYWENPNAKWDWYEIGGRWNGFFKLKEKHLLSIAGEPGVLGSHREDYRGRADQCMKGDVDFEGMINEEAKEAEEKYDFILGIYNNEIPKIEYLWKSIIDEKNKKYNKMNIEEKRKIYWNQSALMKRKSVVEMCEKLPLNKKNESLLIWHDLNDFQCSKEEYIQRAKNKAFITFAYVKDSKWYKKGEMGWWACVSNEMDENEWQDMFVKEIMALPDHTLLTIVDCHI